MTNPLKLNEELANAVLCPNPTCQANWTQMRKSIREIGTLDGMNTDNYEYAVKLIMNCPVCKNEFIGKEE